MSTTLFLNLGTPELLIIFLVVLPVFLIIYCLTDIMRSDFKDSTTKLLWVIIVLVAPFIGSIIYIMLGKNQKVTS